ncbi:phosphatase PAP2 family protein [Tersicoccus sp. MR15.9]|uniref:phosphatase PAP2 family protein n=1 Tax=Tersicoccus mangrovi TaxID=3121635 RepID=UPI002FE66A17
MYSDSTRRSRSASDVAASPAAASPAAVSRAGSAGRGNEDAHPWADARDHEPAHLRTRVATAVAGMLVVLVGGLLLVHSSVDLPAAEAFASVHVGFVALVTNAVYTVVEPAGAVVIAALIAVVVWWTRRSLRDAMAFGLTVAVTWLPTGALKYVLDRPRPNPALLSHPFSPTQVDGSFPSGHAAFITALAVTLVLLTAGTRAQAVMRIVAPLVALFVVASVLIDAVHFPTDVLASVIWSLTVTPLVWTLVGWALDRWCPRRWAARRA